MFVIMSVLCLFTEGLREDWLYKLSHPPKIKYLLTLLTLCERKYFAIVSVTNIHCERNIARGNLALFMKTNDENEWDYNIQIM